MADVSSRHAGAHLVIVGGGDRSFDNCEADLKTFVRESGQRERVTFTGHVNDVTNYLRASDLFVLCSESEGFGLSLVEAMVEGLPCVSTTVGVAPEIIDSGISEEPLANRSAAS